MPSVSVDLSSRVGGEGTDTPAGVVDLVQMIDTGHLSPRRPSPSRSRSTAGVLPGPVRPVLILPCPGSPAHTSASCSKNSPRSGKRAGYRRWVNAAAADVLQVARRVVAAQQQRAVRGKRPGDRADHGLRGDPHLVLPPRPHAPAIGLLQPLEAQSLHPGRRPRKPLLCQGRAGRRRRRAYGQTVRSPPRWTRSKATKCAGHSRVA
jgi:hypothetical protein